MTLPNPFVEEYINLPNEASGFRTVEKRKIHFYWSLAALIIGIFVFFAVILLLIFFDPAGIINESSTSINEVDGTCSAGYGRASDGSCKACVSGSYGDGRRCSRCKAGTYAPVPASAACSPCPGSTEGATSCEVSAPVENGQSTEAARASVVAQDAVDSFPPLGASTPMTTDSKGG